MHLRRVESTGEIVEPKLAQANIRLLTSLIDLQDHAEAAATKARKQAEDELAQAAESDRAAHVASSMQKEARRAGYGTAAAQVSTIPLCFSAGSVWALHQNHRFY